MCKTGLALYVLLPVLLLFLTGCGEELPQDKFQHKSGIYFDFPDGWSRLSKQEWRDLDLGTDQTLVTIMDKNREAGFSLIATGMQDRSSIDFKSPANGPGQNAILSVNAIDAAGPNKYENYSLWEKGTSIFAGFPMAEIIFEGKSRGKSLRWYRLLVFESTDSNRTTLMLLFSTPMEENTQFDNDFDSIENSWLWDN